VCALTGNLKSKNRILVYLQQVCEQQQQNPFVLPEKKKELASYLGITPETLSRQLAQLGQEGLLKIDGRQITLIEK